MSEQNRARDAEMAHADFDPPNIARLYDYMPSCWPGTRCWSRGWCRPHCGAPEQPTSTEQAHRGNVLAAVGLLDTAR